MSPHVKAFFHEPTGSFSYVVRDAATPGAAIIDPVLEYDPRSGRTGTEAADELIRFVSGEKLSVEWILETHAHADHLTAAQYLRDRLGGRIAIGAGIVAVQTTFRAFFNLHDFSTDGSQFDRLLADGECLAIGAAQCRVLSTPGHTSDSVSYLIGDAAFVGDTLFAPDVGTARTDFPGGDARVLYDSIQRVFGLAPDTRVFLCHDYPAGQRAHEYVHPLRVQRERNVHVHDGVDRDTFVQMREARDAGLAVPELLIPAIQVNIRAGRLPQPEDNGVSYLKIPIDRLEANA